MTTNETLAARIRDHRPIRRILALEGGGIRGVFSVEVLLRLEAVLREKLNAPQLVLSDYFDLIGGTSTGAIIASCLAWGMPVAEIRRFYHESSSQIFSPTPWYLKFKHKFIAQNISRLLQEAFLDDDGSPASLGSTKLKSVLLMVMRNQSTGSAWPVTNNPFAKHNAPELPDSNLLVPLWQLVRASTAAPTFFEPETIVLGSNRFVFVDGALTPYNNPSVACALTAMLPQYHIGWPTGEDRMLVVSVGTGRKRSGDLLFTQGGMNLLYAAKNAPKALMDGANIQQDLICRVLGKCVFGEEIDSELGDLTTPESTSPGGKRFTYVRYNKLFTNEEVERIKSETGAGFELDNLRLIDSLSQVAADYATESVKPEHLLLP